MKRVRGVASRVTMLCMVFSLVAPFVFTAPVHATGCGRYRVIERHYGWDDYYGNPVCASMCQGCELYERVVGEVITECDGTVSSWGLTNCTYHVSTIIQYSCDCEEPPSQ